MDEQSQILQIQPKLADRWWRLNNLYFIIDENGERVLFRPNEVQAEVYENLHYRNLILKSRQHGMTTLFCILMLDFVLFNNDKKCALTTHKMDASTELFHDKILYPFSQLPDYILNDSLFVPIKKNETQLVFQDAKGNTRSQLSAQVGLRSGTYHWVHICLAGDTEIYTKDGAVKEIKDIVQGDQVLTSKGSYRTVQKLIKNRLQDTNQDLLQISTHGYYKPIKITDRHRVLTRGKRGAGRNEWKAAGQLTLADYVAMPIREYSLKCKGGKLDMGGTKVQPTFDLGWLAGNYLAEGTSRKIGKIQSVTRVSYAVHTKEVSKLVQIVGRESKAFTRPSKGSMIKLQRHKNSKTSVVTVNAKNFATWINTTFGQGDDKAIPDKVWNWGTAFVQGLIKGYIDGDGCYTKDTEVTLTSTRRQLIDQMRLLLISARFGVASIYHADAGRKYGRNCKECWTLKLFGDANWKYRKKHGLPLPELNSKGNKWRLSNGVNPSFRKRWRRGRDHYWARVTSINHAEPEQFVYDIALDKDPHNYVTTNGVVHNSEYAKLCSEQPVKAKEIQTGAFETVHEGQILTIESTAEGPSGDFYDKCKEAEHEKREHKPLGNLAWQFFFFAWYQKSSNRTDPKFVEILPEDHLYFDKLERTEKCTINEWQRAWYVVKNKEQGNAMTQEHPSTSDESFFSSVTGSFWAEEIRDLERRFPPQITDVAHDKNIPVHTIHDPGYHWAIWFVQNPMGLFPKIIRHYEFTGSTKDACETLDRYKEIYGYRYGKHIVPLDADSNATKVIDGKTIMTHAKKNGYNFTKMTKVVNALTLIEKTRVDLTNFWFDRKACEDGLNSLRSFRRKKDKTLSTDKVPVYINKYVHDNSSHSASALYHFVKARKAGLFDDEYGDSISIEEIRRLNRQYSRVHER